MHIVYIFIAFLVSASLAGLNFLHEKEHSQARIQGFDQYLKCMKNDYTRNDGDFWNNGGDIRFKHPSLLPGSLVIEVGGNSGRDSLEFLTRYKGIEYYTFEPMPNFIKTLRSKLVDTNLIPANHILEFGVDRFDGNFSFCENGYLGEGTSAFGDSSVKCDNLVTLPVRRGSHAISQILQLSGKNEIGLLTVNCEGCEYGLFESLIEDNLFHKINIIQYSRHLLKTVPLLLPRSCRIQEHLAMHHYVKYEYPFVWESWYLKPNTVSAGQV
jgi:FkbM family methyltransferase